MGFLSDIQHDDARFGFFNADEHGESVTITKADGTTYAPVAIVDRTVIPSQDEYDAGHKEVMLIEFENHATRGILSTAFDAHKWTVTVAYRPGETAKARVLGMPVSVDAVHMIFRVY